MGLDCHPLSNFVLFSKGNGCWLLFHNLLRTLDKKQWSVDISSHRNLETGVPFGGTAACSVLLGQHCRPRVGARACAVTHKLGPEARDFRSYLRAFLLQNYRFICATAVYEILPSFLTFPDVTGKILFHFYFLSITKLNVCLCTYFCLHVVSCDWLGHSLCSLLLFSFELQEPTLSQR